MELRVKEICKEKGITLGELADRMEIARESLSRAINGNPTLDTLSKISNALEVSTAELFEKANNDPSINCPKCGNEIIITIK